MTIRYDKERQGFSAGMTRKMDEILAIQKRCSLADNFYWLVVF